MLLRLKEFQGEGDIVKKLLLSGVALAALAVGPALAADLPITVAPRYMPPPPPIPVFSWTGFYVGLNVGGTWSDQNSINVVSSPFANFGLGPGNYAASSAVGATGSVPVGGNGGFIGGAQIGYNWQFSPVWLYGLEADIQGVASQTQSGTIATAVGPFPFFGSPEVLSTQITSSKQLDYIGTVRGRLGYLFTPTLLVYGTGGLAYGGVKASTSINQSNNDCVFFPTICIQGAASTAGLLSETRVGWTAGAGLEWMFAPRWSAKVEYLFYDLGSSVTFNNGALAFGSGGFPGAGGPSVVTSQSSVDFQGQIVRVGVNFHF
jgi:outer membrane immunogenic protein